MKRRSKRNWLPARPVAGLSERIRQRIRDDGPMRFRDWMDSCLYDPDGGYYMQPGRKTGAGDDADFATSPTLHPFLAQAVAGEAAETWSALGEPSEFHIVEFGGGEGDLARDALAWLDSHDKQFAKVVNWIHIEISPSHRQAQQADDDRIGWATEMPVLANGLVLAHEFVDAMPFAVLEWRKNYWSEVHVGVDGEKFVEILGLPSRSAVEAAPKRKLEDGQRVVAMSSAQTWLSDVVDALRRGRILIIDYGDTGRRLWTSDSADGTVRGFRNQQLVDPLSTVPGDCDITASVDFTQLEQWATFDGFQAKPLLSQERFLLEHGALDAIAAAPKDTVEDASAYLRLKQLVLPQAMGGAFKVLRLDRGMRDGDS